ncbi:protein FAM151B [Brachionichthys hirsutus]|uniref:protein FAM151B n=1 Tax=Brachionichthys hirsutus TaxID=412623 RepID=UPI003604D707
MSDQTLDYFLSRKQIRRKDAADVRWSHAVNSRRRLAEALSGSAHMIEADIIMGRCDPEEPIMAHPPDTDSDITLKEWLVGMTARDKGMKLDFKSLEAVSPAVALLTDALAEPRCPVWINADILAGPGGKARPVEPEAFLSAVRSLPTQTVLSLGWTTGWTPGTHNPGYSWDLVHAMEDTCRTLQHPVSFPVRAALLAQSFSQMAWLLQQSERYTLTVWTHPNDGFTLEDLLPYRKAFGRSRIYYDLPDSVWTELRTTSPDS